MPGSARLLAATASRRAPGQAGQAARARQPPLPARTAGNGGACRAVATSQASGAEGVSSGDKAAEPPRRRSRALPLGVAAVGSAGVAYAWWTGALPEQLQERLPASLVRQGLSPEKPPAPSTQEPKPALPVSPSDGQRYAAQFAAPEPQSDEEDDTAQPLQPGDEQQPEPAPAAAVDPAEEARVAAAAAATAKALKQAALATSEATCQQLASMEQDRLKAEQQREVARQELRQAVEAGDPAAIQEALATAKACHLGATSETKLAEKLVAAKVSLQDVDELLQLPAELRGKSASEAAGAERAACESLGREELEARVVELTGMLAAARLHARARLEQGLRSRLEAADAASLGVLEAALEVIAEERGAAFGKELKDLEAGLKKRYEEELAHAARAAAEEAARGLDLEREQLQAAAEHVMMQERSLRVPEVLSHRRGFDALEEVLQKEADAVQTLHTYNGLAVAVLCLEGAMHDGKRSAAEELAALRKAASETDAFSEAILAALPAESVELCSRAAVVPTEPLLREQLSSQLGGFIAAAFVPPGGGLLREIVGLLFQKLYVLKPDASPHKSLAGGSESDISKNLTTLAGASSSDLNLQEVISRLDNLLPGLCKERVAAWLAEARAALVLRQALDAVKARARCLTSPGL